MQKAIAPCSILIICVKSDAILWPQEMALLMNISTAFNRNFETLPS